MTVVFNIGLARLNDGTTNFATDSGPSGKLRALLLTHADSNQMNNILAKTLTTVAACKSASGYAEYDDAENGYPTPSNRPRLPQLSVTANQSGGDRAEVTPPGAPDNIISFGSPGASTNPIRYVLIYEHFGTADASNIPIVAIDEGTIVGQNGSPAQLPMNFSWGSRVADIAQA